MVKYVMTFGLQNVPIFVYFPRGIWDSQALVLHLPDKLLGWSSS